MKIAIILTILTLLIRIIKKVEGNSNKTSNQIKSRIEALANNNTDNNKKINSNNGITNPSQKLIEKKINNDEDFDNKPFHNNNNIDHHKSVVHCNNINKHSIETFHEKELYKEEEKELANFEQEDKNEENNVFWNMSKGPNNINNEEDDDNQSLRKCKSTNNYMSKGQVKNYNTSQLFCTFSKIDKGNAIFVSSDDTIFTLPLNFLPKNASLGNSYKITIEETEKIHKKITYLQNIQKKFLFLNFDENN